MKKAVAGTLIVCIVIVTVVTVAIISHVGHAMIPLINQMTSDTPAATPTAKTVHKPVKH
jgi:hypothetical protein